MSSRNVLLREMLLLALGIGGGVIVLLVVGLSVSGNLSALALAHAMVITGAAAGVIDLLLLPRALRVNHVQGPLHTWRVTDRSQGCSAILLGALVTVGLLVCGGLVELGLAR